MILEWKLDIGNLLTIVGFAMVLWRQQNKKHEENVKILHDLQEKMTYVWKWFQREHGFNGDDE